MLRSSLYLRVSTDPQAKEGTSLTTQEQVCLKKAQAMGAVVVGIDRDEGVSGAKYASRKGINAAIERVEQGEVDVVIVANLSRYSRDSEHQQSIKKRIEKAGGRLVFCDMDLPDTPEGNLAFGIFGNFAEYERHVIAKRTKDGRRRKAEGGQQPSRSRSPYGYVVVNKEHVVRGEYPAECIGKYVVLHDQAQVVQRIFQLVNSGMTLGQVASTLEREGARTPRGSRVWHRETIRAILRNPCHKGEAAFGRTRAVPDERFKQAPKRPTDPSSWTIIPCPALVSVEEWEQAQEHLERNKAKAGRPNETMWLSGLLVCPLCGSRMFSSTTVGPYQSWSSYRCQHSKPDVSLKCDQKGLKVAEVDKVVREALVQLSSQESVRKALERFKKEQRQRENPMVAWQEQWDRIERKEKAAYQTRMEAAEIGMVADSFKEILRDIKAEKDRLLKEKPVGEFLPEQMEWVSQFSEVVLSMLVNKEIPTREVNNALKDIIQSVCVDQKECRLHFYSPLKESQNQQVEMILSVEKGKVRVVGVQSPH